MKQYLCNFVEKECNSRILHVNNCDTSTKAIKRYSQIDKGSESIDPCALKILLEDIFKLRENTQKI